MFKKAVLILLILAVMQGCGATQYKKKMFGKYKVYKKESGIVVSERSSTKNYRAPIKFSAFEDQLLMLIVENKDLKLEELVENSIAYNLQKQEEDAKKKKESTTNGAISITEGAITTGGAVVTDETAVTGSAVTTEAAIEEKKDREDTEETPEVFKKKKKIILKERYKCYLGIKYSGRDWIYINRLHFKDLKSGTEAEIPFGNAVSESVTLENGVTVTGGVYEAAFFTVTREEAEKIYNIMKSENIEMSLLSMYDERKMTRVVKDKEKKEIIKSYEFYLKIYAEEADRIKKGIEDKEKADKEKIEKEKAEKENKVEKEEKKESLKEESKEEKKENKNDKKTDKKESDNKKEEVKK